MDPAFFSVAAMEKTVLPAGLPDVRPFFRPFISPYPLCLVVNTSFPIRVHLGLKWRWSWLSYVNGPNDAFSG